MIIVSGSLRLAASAVPSLAQAMRTVVETTRSEPGCIVYCFAEDVMEPGLIRIYEEWESREALATHGHAAHVAAWHQALAGVEVLGRQLVTIEAGDVQPLA